MSIITGRDRDNIFEEYQNHLLDALYDPTTPDDIKSSLQTLLNYTNTTSTGVRNNRLTTPIGREPASAAAASAPLGLLYPEIPGRPSQKFPDTIPRLEPMASKASAVGLTRQDPANARTAAVLQNPRTYRGLGQQQPSGPLSLPQWADELELQRAFDPEPGEQIDIRTAPDWGRREPYPRLTAPSATAQATPGLDPNYKYSTPNMDELIRAQKRPGREYSPDRYDPLSDVADEVFTPQGVFAPSAGEPGYAYPADRYKPLSNWERYATPSYSPEDFPRLPEDIAPTGPNQAINIPNRNASSAIDKITPRRTPTSDKTSRMRPQGAAPAPAAPAPAPAAPTPAPAAPAPAPAAPVPQSGQAAPATATGPNQAINIPNRNASSAIDKITPRRTPTSNDLRSMRPAPASAAAPAASTAPAAPAPAPAAPAAPATGKQPILVTPEIFKQLTGTAYNQSSVADKAVMTAGNQINQTLPGLDPNKAFHTAYDAGIRKAFGLGSGGTNVAKAMNAFSGFLSNLKQTNPRQAEQIANMKINSPTVAKMVKDWAATATIKASYEYKGDSRLLWEAYQDITRY